MPKPKKAKKKAAKKSAGPTHTAQEMVKPANRLVVLEKKPAPGELKDAALEIIEVIEAKGGSVEEDQLIPALAEKFSSPDAKPPVENVLTFWDYWRAKLVDMGILAIKPREPDFNDDNPGQVTPRK